MKFFGRKKLQPYVYTWESEPYAFVPGAIYVIEFDENNIRLKDVQYLADTFTKHGVIVMLIGSRTGKTLNPIKVKRKKEQV